MFKYFFAFKNGKEISAKMDIDIDFHSLDWGLIVFDDLLINMDELIYITKTVINTSPIGESSLTDLSKIDPIESEGKAYET